MLIQLQEQHWSCLQEFQFWDGWKGSWLDFPDGIQERGKAGQFLEKPHRRFLVFTTKAEARLEGFSRYDRSAGERTWRMPKNGVHISLPAATGMSA